MTTELEKQFFETFGIEPIAEYCKHQCNNELDESACIGCKYIEKVEYPQITDKILLELICICNCHAYYGQAIKPITTKNLKKQVLYHCEIFLKNNEDARIKIRNLFI